MSNIEHILLYLFLFFVFGHLSTYKQERINKKFWKFAIFPIICYILILGCRYGWGNDYLWYKYRFQRPYSYTEENWGFRALNVFLNDWGIGFIGAYILYSFIFIVGAFLLIKSYKCNKYMLSFFLPATLLQSTFTIRQSVAQGFSFIALHFFHKKNWLMLVLMLLISYSIHPAAVLFAVFLLFLFFIKKNLLPKYTIIIYFFVALLGNSINNIIVSCFGQVLPMLTLANKFNNYLQNDYWYGEEAIKTTWAQGLFSFMLTSLFHIGLIYIGYLSLRIKPNHLVRYMYNAVVIGIISQRVFWYFEIFRRISEMFVLLYFIPLGYAFYILFTNGTLKTMKIKERCFSKLSITFILLYLILYFGRFIFLSPDYLFFWNVPNYNEYQYIAPH